VPDSEFARPRFCSRCGRPIVVDDASFCKDCGAALGPRRWMKRDPGFNPVMALVLSIIPGLGHVYRGRVARGIMWFFGVSFCYAAGLGLGVVIHFICASNAAFAGTVREDAFAAPRNR
jgi:NMD protein affecting ribosome stability and mRNA decay